jgi:hypothetical protein
MPILAIPNKIAQARIVLNHGLDLWPVSQFVDLTGSYEGFTRLSKSQLTPPR